MSTPTNDGGPAFPGGISATSKPTDDAVPTQPGMSLRDYFAAKAMQGFCAGKMISMSQVSELAEDSYAIADAMLAARNQTTK